MQTTTTHTEASRAGLLALAADLDTIARELRATADGAPNPFADTPTGRSLAFGDFLALILPGESYDLLPRALRCTTCGEYSLTALLDERGHCAGCARMEAAYEEHARQMAQEQRCEEMAEAAAPRCPDCNGPTRWVDDEDGGYHECAAERGEGCPARQMTDPFAEEEPALL